ncbi:MAG: type II/IV secretion system ATPase subunit [Candidatus Methanomethylophilaceae archaeon]|nr:type II/IV secretion system ATPase subunit [Candidatus Methanomethylophilaceae archaeon]
MARIVDSEMVSDVLSIEEYPVRRTEVQEKKTEAERVRPSIPPLMESLAKIERRSARKKPVYADTWLIGSSDELDEKETYETDAATIVIGTAEDGETEYNITPNEYNYPQELDAIVEDAILHLRNVYRKTGGHMDRLRVLSIAEDYLWGHEDEISSLLAQGCDVRDVISELSDVVYRYTIGKGIFDILLADKRLEDIYVDAPCEKNRIHVTLNNINGSNSHARCRTNLIAGQREMRNLITLLMRESNLPFCESNPILETDMGDSEARATVVGYPMSPNGDSLAIRKHSQTPWTLSRLIGNGTIDAYTAGVLSFLVDNRSTILVSGARGAGKSSLLSALMFEFPISQRILTIEDTLELPGKKMRSMGYKVQSMLIDDRNGEAAEKRADEALRVSLRLGESAIILGEVRGEEAKTLYQSMSTGRAGSSIMGTIHGDCARTVYNRVTKDLQIPAESFMETDFIITMGTVKDRGTDRQVRTVTEFVSTTKRNGWFSSVTKKDGLMKSVGMKRILKSNSMTEKDVMNEIEIRAKLREFLAEMAEKNGEGYYGPEWIVLANDHLKRSLSAGISEPETVIRTFKERLGIQEGQ